MASRNLALLSLALAGLLGSASGALADKPAKKLDLFLVAGQSNAVGFDAAPKDLPADDSDKQVMFWWRCGDPPPDEFDSVSRQWTTLQPQPKPEPKKGGDGRQYGNFRAAEGGFGPEIRFARALLSTEKKPFAVVKVAFSGTSLAQDWEPKRGDCFRALVDETRAATAKAAEQGIELRLRALVWVQGESDANANGAPEYGKRLGEMIGKLREELKAPELIALVGVNTNFGGGRNKFMPVIVEQQKALASRLERCAYVDTSGVTYANDAHFDAKGTIEVGNRFADALLKLEGDLKAKPGK